MQTNVRFISSALNIYILCTSQGFLAYNLIEIFLQVERRSERCSRFIKH